MQSKDNRQTRLQMVRFNKGAYITVEGKSDNDHFYIIREGRVQINKSTEVVQEESSNILGPGDFFGVISAMASQRRIETARSLTECTLIVVPREEYSRLIVQNTRIAMKIIESFSRRMRLLDTALTKIEGKADTDSSPTGIFEIAGYYMKHNKPVLAGQAYSEFVRLCPNDPNVERAKKELAELAEQNITIPDVFVPRRDGFTHQFLHDTAIFLEHMKGQELFIIQSGSVKITKISNGNEIMLALLRPGDIFGEMALLEEKPRSASAIAFEDSVLLSVNKANFERIVHTQSQIISRLTTLLAERIWVLYRQLANTTILNKLGRLYDAIIVQLERSHVDMNQDVAHTLTFGPKELISWTGISQTDGSHLIQELLNDRTITISDGKLHILSIEELKKQAQYYRKIATRKAENR